MNILKMVNKLGRINVRCVLQIFVYLNMMNFGMKSICGGIIIIDRQSRNSVFFFLKLIWVNLYVVKVERNVVFIMLMMDILSEFK